MPQPAAPAPRVILLQPAAPPKPAMGAACNGCGVCCAAEPCPLGQLLSRRRRGACAALEWHAADGRYRCGALASPARWLPWLPARWAQAWVRRWIAAGAGCDAAFDARPAPPAAPGQP